MNHSPLRKRIQQTLWERFRKSTNHDADEKGYVSSVEQNLLPGVTLDMFQHDLAQGSGNELEGKFKAVHSSSALAVNTFAPFTKDPARLSLANKKGFIKVQFERQCPTGLGGTPPNLDVIAESSTAVVAIESKFLEYLTPKKPHFAKSYTRDNLPEAEECWFELIEMLQQRDKQYFDSAQLVKHYLGLRNQPEFKGKKITLLYLFWEPENWSDFDVFKKHREEIHEFSKQVESSDVSFQSQSYSALWKEWQGSRVLAEHVKNLLQRYRFQV
jgi:hypothetical protein